MIDGLVSEDVKDVIEEFRPDFFEGKRTLVTGGAGFLGSYLCDVILMLGSEVTCLDNFSTGKMENVEHIIGKANFRLINSDILSFETRGLYDYIFSFAARPSPEDYQRHPIETLCTNSHGTFKILELARKCRARIIFASTSEVYGDPNVFPTPEDYWGNVNPIGMRSCYDEGKRFGEALSIAYHRQYGVDSRIVRIFNTYGPRIRADGAYARALPRFILQALNNEDISVYGDGSQTRSFCYVTDTLRGILSAFSADVAEGEVFNIGNPEEVTILELAEKIRNTARSNSKIRFCPLPPDDPKRRRPDITKAKKILNWSPRVSLTEGLNKTIKWFILKHVC